MKKICGIYKITSPSNKVYIGQSVDIRGRVSKYKHLKCNKQERLYRSLVKYGFSSHKIEIVIECHASELNKMERYYQDLFCCIGKDGLNCVLTRSDEKRYECSEITRKRKSESLKGRIVSPETRAKISKSHMGKKMSPEAIRKGVEKRKGLIVPVNRRLKISKSHKGKIKSRTHLENISKAKTGHSVSQETKNKISLNNRSNIMVVNNQNGVYYENISKASESLTHVSELSLSRKLRGLFKNNTYFVYA